MEALAQFTANAADALAKEGFCVIQLPLSLGDTRGLDPVLMPAFLWKSGEANMIFLGFESEKIAT